MVIKNPSENFNNKPTDRSAKPKEIQHLQDVQQLKEEQKMNITYHEENGYLISNVWFGCETNRTIGRYGRLRRKYLKEYRPVLFSIMAQNGTLFDHLTETEDAAQSRLEIIVPVLAKAAGATEALKVTDQMKWVGIMNDCKAQAEEIIFQEIIFA